MKRKLAVMILHGAGTPKTDFADEMIENISKRFAEKLDLTDSHEVLIFEPVFWSSVFESEQEKLWDRLNNSADLDYQRLRRFTVEFLADAIAYQPSSLKGNNYDKVHAVLAQSMYALAVKAGPTAPLCIISHSLGSIVSSNYFYDLQEKKENIGSITKSNIQDSPLEKGETLALFYSMGSPMALWSLRFLDYGVPIQVPVPSISQYYPDLKGEWVNFYDKDDILAYPLKGLNHLYKKAVSEDVQVNAGGGLTSWNPFSHTKYESEDAVVERIVNGLVDVWKETS